MRLHEFLISHSLLDPVSFSPESLPFYIFISQIILLVLTIFLPKVFLSFRLQLITIPLFYIPDFPFLF